MARFIRLLARCYLIAAIIMQSSLSATINFGNRDSGFVFFPEGSFNNGSNNLIINGILSLKGSPIITGNDITFASGVLERDDVQSTLNGTFKVSQLQILTDNSTSTPPVVLTSGPQKKNQVVTITNAQTFISSADPINITANNITIDGAGSTFYFAGAVGDQVGLGSQGGPLFIVAPNVTVTLRNITLSNITQDTFALGDGATLAFDKNVTLDFGGDVFFTSGTLKIVDLNTETDSFNVVRMNGINGKKRLTLSPTNGNQTTMIDLNNNSLALQNMELVGSPFITSNGPFSSIALTGGTLFDVSASTGLNFDIENNDNTLALTNDGMTLAGGFNFNGLAVENILSVRFVLNAPIINKTITSMDANGKYIDISVKHGNPLVIFNGDTGVYLTNQTTLAGLVFEDQSISIGNGLDFNSNAFVIDQNSLLIAQNIEILCNPLKQQSTRFTLEANKISGLGIDQSFVRNSRSHVPKVLTAFSKMIEHKRAHKPVAKIHPLVNHKVSSSKVVQVLNKNKKQKRMQTRSLVDLVDGKKLPTKSAFSLPSSYTRTIHGSIVTNSVPEAGSSLYDNALVYDFQTSNTVECTVTMEAGAVLNQLPGNSLQIDNTHTLNITGQNNQLVINSDAMIDFASINFDPNNQSSLKITCNSINSVLPTITVRGTLNLPSNAAFLFEGVGQVIFTDGTVISFYNGGFLGRQPIFSVGNGFDLLLEPNATAYVGGIGRFEITDNSKLIIKSGSSLVIADFPRTMPPTNNHSIDFSATRKSIVVVGGETDSGMLRFAGQGKVDFTIDNATIIIGTAGRVAFNMNAQGGVQRGNLSAFTLNYAAMILRGALEFGPNMYDYQFKDLSSTILFTESTLAGTGSVIVHNENPISGTTSNITKTVVPHMVVGTTLNGINQQAAPASIASLINGA